MYKLKKCHKKIKEVVTTADKTEVGDLMVCIEETLSFNGEILLRTYSNIVSLSNPKNVWDNDAQLEVRILPKGTIIKLKVKKQTYESTIKKRSKTI